MWKEVMCILGFDSIPWDYFQVIMIVNPLNKEDEEFIKKVLPENYENLGVYYPYQWNNNTSQGELKAFFNKNYEAHSTWFGDMPFHHAQVADWVNSHRSWVKDGVVYCKGCVNHLIPPNLLKVLCLSSAIYHADWTFDRKKDTDMQRMRVWITYCHMPLEKINKYPAIMNRVSSMRMYTTYFIDEEEDLKAEIERLKENLLLKENEVLGLKKALDEMKVEWDCARNRVKEKFKKQKEEYLALRDELETWKVGAPVERPVESKIIEEIKPVERPVESKIIEEIRFPKLVKEVVELLLEGKSQHQVSELLKIHHSGVEVKTKQAKELGLIKNIGSRTNPKWIKGESYV